MIINNRKNRNLSLLTTSLLGGLALVQNVSADTEVTLPASVLAKIQEAERAGVKVTITEEVIKPESAESVQALIDKLTSEYDSVITDLEKAIEVVKSNTGSQAEYERLMSEYNTEVARINSENEARKQKYEELLAEYKEKKALSNAGQEELAAYERLMSAYDSKKAEYERNLETYRQALEKYEADLAKNQEAIEYNKQVTAENEAKKAQYAEQMAKFNSDMAEYREEELDNVNLRLNNERLAFEYDRAKAEYDEAKAKYDSDLATYRRLVEESKQAQREYDEGMRQYNTAKTEYDAAKAAYDSAMTIYNSDMAEYRRIEDEYNRAKSQYYEAFTEYNRKMAEYQARQQEIARIQEQNRKNEADYQAALTEYNRAKAEYDAKVAERDRIAGEVSAANEQYEQERQAYETAKAKYDADVAKWSVDYMDNFVDYTLETYGARLSRVYQQEGTDDSELDNKFNMTITTTGEHVAYTVPMKNSNDVQFAMVPKIAERFTQATPHKIMVAGVERYFVLLDRGESVTVEWTPKDGTYWNPSGLLDTGSFTDADGNTEVKSIKTTYTNIDSGMPDGKQVVFLTNNLTKPFLWGMSDYSNLFTPNDFDFNPAYNFTKDELKYKMETVAVSANDKPMRLLAGVNEDEYVARVASGIKHPTRYEYNEKSPSVVSGLDFAGVSKYVATKAELPAGYQNDLHGEVSTYIVPGGYGVGGDRTIHRGFVEGKSLVEYSVTGGVAMSGMQKSTITRDMTIPDLAPLPTPPTEPTPPNVAEVPDVGNPPTPPTKEPDVAVPAPLEQPTPPTEPTKPNNPAPVPPVLTETPPIKPVKKVVVVPKEPTPPVEPVKTVLGIPEVVKPTPPVLEPDKPLKVVSTPEKPTPPVEPEKPVKPEVVELGVEPKLELLDLPTKPMLETEKVEEVVVKKYVISEDVKTRWIDVDGKVLQGEKVGAFPDGEGDDIPGYKFVRTEKDDSGNVTNIYRKVTTKWVDKNGIPLKDPVTGEHPDKEGDDVPGYKLVGTEVDPDGNVVNIYEKNVNTKWVDTDGNQLKDPVDGPFPDKEGDDIPGYKLTHVNIDDHGNVVNVYDKTVKTKWVDEDGKPLKDSVDGSYPDKEGDDIPGYKFVKTETDDQGNVVNVYKKVVTKWVDEDGKTLKDVTDGSFPDKEGDDIPGYKLVKTETDDQGNTVNVYKKVVTKWVDEDGKTLKDPTDGEHPDKEGDDVPGYKLVKTSVDDQGNVINVYKKVVTTKWVDENGKTLKDPTDGEHPDKEGDDLPGYKLVKTSVDDQGNIVNVYKKVVTTKWVDEKGNPLKAPTDGEHPDKEGDDIPGYKLVKTETDDQGNVINVYKKVVTTKWVDENGKTLKAATDGTLPDKEGDDIAGYELVGVTYDENGNVINTYRKVVTPIATPSPSPAQSQPQPLPATGDTSNLMGIIGSSIVGLSTSGMVINKRRKQSRK